VSGPRPRRRGLPSWAISRPIGTVMLATVVLVLGGFYLSRLPLDLLPSIVYPQIRAGLTYPGVEPEVLEEIVAKPLETALAVTEGVTRIETDVSEGRVGVNLHFEYGTNIDLALQDASKNLDRVRAQLPQDANPPTIFKFDPSQIPVYEVAFSSETRDLIDLRRWVEDRLRPQLLTIQGVASVDVTGGLTREVQVVLDQERLRSYGLTVSQVIDALRAGNQDIAAGRVASETREVVGKTAGKFRSVDDIRGLVIPLRDGSRIPLSEVAAINDTNREQRLFVRLDGVPAVRVTIRKQPDANTVAVSDGVDAKLRQLSQSAFFPADIHYRTTENQAGFIRNSVRSVSNAAIAGAVLAMLVVLLFLGSLRKTFVIGLGIPLAILATFVMMGIGGLTLNIMSLGGLALGVGLLIDNSIVMLENIFRRHKEKGGDPEEAAHEGAGEVQTAVIAATSTNLAAVIPFLLITGLSALLFRELILTISFAIVASLTVALTLVPMLSAQLAKVRFSSGIGNTRFLRMFDRGIDALRRGYRRGAPLALRFRWLVIAGAVGAFFAVFPLMDRLGNEFLPQVDDGGVTVMIMLPPGSAPQETNRIALEIERMARGMPHVEHVFASAGGMFFGGSTAEMGGRGSVNVRLASTSQRAMSADEWVRQMQAQINERGFAGARIFVRPPRIRGLRTSTAGSDVALTIQGDDLHELQRVADEVMARVRDVPGLEGVQPSTEEASPTVMIELDRERAAYLGLNVAAVGQTLRTALDGTIATRYTEGNREFDVRVMLPRERFTSSEELESVALFPGIGGGAPIYLRDVAHVYAALGPTTITRENQNRILRITGDVISEVATVGEVNQRIRERLADMQLPEGYSVIYGGEEEAIRENNRQLLIVMLLSIFLVFVVLAVQYESLVNPLVILLAIPLSLVGVGLGLWTTGTPLSAPVLLGVILLAGIVVNNAILLVEYIEQNRRDRAMPMLDAVVDAGAVRLRPILMTTLTTMFGMMPLALGLGEGSELMRPLAIAMVGGLSLSMVLTLIVVPCAYVIFNRGGENLRRWLVGPPAEVEKLAVEIAQPQPQPAGAAAD
jgi:hydrophobe/amphiphile efflux-1 (HAE1) family protein